LNSFFRNFRFWLPVLLWLVVIAIESMFLSSGVTSGWLWRAFRFLHIPIYLDVFDQIHHFLRKAGHVTGYGILCVLAFRGCYRTFLEAKPGNHPSPPKYRRRAALLALGLTLLTAILDEWHQSFDPSRTSSVLDVGLDILGGVIFLSVALFVLKRWRETSARELEPVSA
jgi:VanZ family protein